MKNQEVNIIITTDHLEDGDQRLFFGDEAVVFMDTSTTMFDILTQFGFFQSKSEARKNWKRTGQEIPDGFTDIENIGKMNRRLTILKPMPH